MKSIGFTALLLACTVGCGEFNTSKVSDKNSPQEVSTMKPDNTAINERDRTEVAKTPMDQGEDPADLNKTADIRKRIIDGKMSINAQNVKVITKDGKTSLRGPVASADEKQRIHEIAADVAGSENLDDQLEVKSE